MKKGDTLSLKELAMVLACLMYTRDAWRAKATEQVGDDNLTMRELEALIKKVEEYLRPYRRQ